ncbi:hypothetical protein NLU13_4773 [Sarocladium strictum]|uniref:Uncharacterized protein n=1 Tax=Sarocladium strictum TaxID=5046 RepID=A0AA39GJI7_SARSR|nr:hypothetical protein NLU13_4773 [Sarocladium strictum]
MGSTNGTGFWEREFVLSGKGGGLGSKTQSSLTPCHCQRDRIETFPPTSRRKCAGMEAWSTIVAFQDRQCILDQFLHWAASSNAGRPQAELAIAWTCPMARCRRPFSTQDIMLQHLRGCQELRSTEFWCHHCFAVESFAHSKCPICPYQLCLETSPASKTRDFFDSIGCSVSSNLTSEVAVSNLPDDAVSRSSCSIDRSSTTPNLILDPRLSPSPLLADPEIHHDSAMSRGSGFPRSEETSPARTRSQSPFLLTTHYLPVPATPDWRHRSTNGTRSGSTEIWEDIAHSDCSEGYLHRVYPASVSSPLPDELPTPKGLSSAWLESLVSGDLKTAGPYGGVFSELERDIYESKTRVPGCFVSGHPVIGQPTPRKGGPSFDHLSINTNMALTDDAEVPFDFSTFRSEDQALQNGCEGVPSPRFLVRTTWSTLRIHMDSSLYKLRNISQSPLASQFSVMTPADVVDRGTSAFLEAMAGRECTSPLNLICLIHLSYAMYLAVYAEMDLDRSKEFFTTAMSYSERLELSDRQPYINMVDALWRPGRMVLTDVVGLLHGNSWSLNGPGSSPSCPSVPYGATLTDPILRIVEVVLSEFENAVIRHPTEPEFTSSSLYNRHLGDLGMVVHRSQPFILATRLLLQTVIQQVSDVASFADAVADMLDKVSTAHFMTARRFELETLSIGKSHLNTTRFLGHCVPMVQNLVSSLYTRNPSPDCQRLSYLRDSASLMMFVCRRMEQRVQVEVPLSFCAKTSPALNPIGDFLSTIPSSAGNFGLQHDTGPYAIPVSPYAGVVAQDGEGLQPTPGFIAVGTSSSPITNPSTSPTGGMQNSSVATDSAAGEKIESNTTCTLCGYRPKGDPRWFGGSMAKHMKLQHATSPPKIYRCPYPGCTSQFQKRPDNLRQHQIDKGHFVDGQGNSNKRALKRKKA